MAPLSHSVTRSANGECSVLSLLSRTSFGSSSTLSTGYWPTSPVSCVVQTCTDS